MNPLFVLHDESIRARALKYLCEVPLGMVVEFRRPKRTDSQNNAQWPILRCFSKQLVWPVNGQMVKMTEKEWKMVLTAAFHNETVRLAAGLNGGVVMLGDRTSEFDVEKFSEWLEFLHSIAAEREVNLDWE